MTKGIPTGSHTLTPHLVVGDVAAAIEFYKKAFGATENLRLEGPGNTIMHAEVQIGDSKLMLGGECKEYNNLSPLTLKGSPVTIHIYVENVDEAFPKALAAGAKEMMPVTDMFWGDRYGVLMDPFGHSWSMATRTRDLSPEEIKAGAAACFPEPVA